MDAITRLNYRPSALAKGLASKRTCLVGVVLSDINNPLFRTVYKRIESALSEAGYDLILANTGEDIEQVLPCELIIRGSCPSRCFHEFSQQQKGNLSRE